MPTFQPASFLNGQLRIPGDKSLSHRAAIFSALTSEKVVIKDFLFSADCLSTLNCLSALGVNWHRIGGDVVLQGVGLHGFTSPKLPLDAGNSGTTARLLLGILAGQNFTVQMRGDASLSKRPMGRVLKPLAQMGASFTAVNDNFLPITKEATFRPLSGLRYQMPVASAQLKSALLLAALYADGPSTITEPSHSRDHTERMLQLFNADISRNDTCISLLPHRELHAPTTLQIPADISSAAYWLVAATIIPHSHIELPAVGINEYRCGLICALQKMGAHIILRRKVCIDNEWQADITVSSAQLHGIDIGKDDIPQLIDEIPILSVAALFASGKTHISGAEELRFKESDRLHSIASELNKLAPGAVTETSDGLIIDPSIPKQWASCSSHLDHRIAMSLIIAMAAGRGGELDEIASIDISYPQFLNDFTQLAYYQ